MLCVPYLGGGILYSDRTIRTGQWSVLCVLYVGGGICYVCVVVCSNIVIGMSVLDM